jgi:ATF/CREB family transcription factor
MLSGPANDYFDGHHIRGFPTPNESSMRTGLTPGGGGSMFPASSPGSQAVLAQLASSGATPGTLDFHRTALSAAAAAKREQQSLQPGVTSQPQDTPQGAAPTKPETKAPVGHFDPHDNDAANGLFLLANGRNNGNAQPQTQYTIAPQQQVHAQRGSVSGPQASTSPHVTKTNPSAAGRSARGASEAGSAASDESEQARPNTRGKGKRGSNAGAGASNGRRKADDTVAKGPASKKAKTNGGSANSNHGYEDMDMYEEDDDDSKHDEGGSKSKMTDEEKRKNFLERNR